MNIAKERNGGEDHCVDRLEDCAGHKATAEFAHMRTKPLDTPPDDGEEEAEEESVFQFRISEETATLAFELNKEYPHDLTAGQRFASVQ